MRRNVLFELDHGKIRAYREYFDIGAEYTSMMAARRESDVLDELLQGQSNRQIGRNLFISEDTVKSHVRSVPSAPSRASSVASASKRR